MKETYAEQVLNDGLDESAEELVGMGGVDRLTNGVFRREGGITKRPGFSLPTNNDVNAVNTPANAGHTLVARGGALRVLRKTDDLAVTAVGSGVDDSPKSRVFPGHLDVVTNLYDGRGFRACDASTGRLSGTLLACVAGDCANVATPTIVLKVVEVESGAVLATGALVGERPRVVWRESGGSGTFHVYYQVASGGGYDCKVATLNMTTRAFSVVGTALNNGDGVAVSTMAVCPDSASAAHTFVAWMDDDTTTLRVKRIDFAGAVSSSTTVAGTTGGERVALSQSVNHPEWLHAVYAAETGAGAANDVYLVGVRADFTAVGTPIDALVIPNAGSERTRAVTVVDLGDSGTASGDHLAVAATWHDGLNAATLYRSYTYLASGSPTLPSYSAAAGGVQTIPDTELLAHGAAVCPDDETASAKAFAALALARLSDDLGDQDSRLSIPTGFLMSLPHGPNIQEDATPALMSQLLTDESYQGLGDNPGNLSLYDTYQLPSVVRDSMTGSYYVAQLALEQLPTATFSQYGIKLLRLTFNTLATYTRPLPRATLGSLTYLGGDVLRFSDGAVVGEAIPLLPPPTPDDSAITESINGSLTLLGTYSFRFVLQFEDAQGLVHRSAPSPPVSKTLTGANDELVVDWAALWWPTDLHPSHTGLHWKVEVYRTLANGAVYFFDKEFSASPGVAYSIHLTASDTTLGSNKVLYTEGDVLANEAPPPLKALCAVGNRLFGIDATDPRSIVFSKELEEGYAAEFNAALGFRLEASDSEPVALAALGDLLVMFTRSEAWAISTHGGPDALGAGSFGLPQRIATDVGAANAESAVSIPLGVLVHGSAGLRLLAPGGSASVSVVADSASASYSVVRALHVPSREEAWFALRGPNFGRILVVSYARGKVRWMNWNVLGATTGVLPDIRDMALVNDTPYLLTHEFNAGPAREYFLMKFDPSTYLDGGSATIPVSVRTRWFKPEGAFGDSRFRRLHVLGKAGSGHDLTAKIYVMGIDGSPDDDDGGVDWLRGTADWTAAQLANDDRIIHVRRRLKDQRGAAVRVELTLTDVNTGTVGPVLHAAGWDFAVRGTTAPRGASYEGT